MKIRSLLSLLILALMLPGCASLPANSAHHDTGSQTDTEKMRAVHSDLIEQMIEQGNYHAALAHIEELKRGDARVDRISLLHARVLFRMSRAQEAHAEYARLMGTAFDAEAMHGIGLIYTVTNPPMALDYLGKAARGGPTQAGIRNDYGYALLRQGDFDKAQVELTTAHELAPQDPRYRNNAILASLLAADTGTARELADKARMSDAAFERLRKQAENWQTPDTARQGPGRANGKPVSAPEAATTVAATTDST